MCPRLQDQCLAVRAFCTHATANDEKYTFRATEDAAGDFVCSPSDTPRAPKGFSNFRAMAWGRYADHCTRKAGTLARTPHLAALFTHVWQIKLPRIAPSLQRLPKKAPLVPSPHLAEVRCNAPPPARRAARDAPSGPKGTARRARPPETPSPETGRKGLQETPQGCRRLHRKTAPMSGVLGLFVVDCPVTKPFEKTKETCAQCAV